MNNLQNDIKVGDIVELIFSSGSKIVGKLTVAPIDNYCEIDGEGVDLSNEGETCISIHKILD